VELARPFPRLAYDDAMARFGSDKPDLRFGLELQDASALFAAASSRPLPRRWRGRSRQGAAHSPAGGMSRKELDDLTSEAKQLGAKGARLDQGDGRGPAVPVAKFLTAVQDRLLALTGGTTGDLLLLVADTAGWSRRACSATPRRPGPALPASSPKAATSLPGSSTFRS